MVRTDREADLRLGRRAVKLQLLRGPDLVRALLELGRRRVPLRALLVDLGLLVEEQLDQVERSLHEDPPEPEEPSGPGNLGEVLLGVRLDKLHEQGPGWSTFFGRGADGGPLTVSVFADGSYLQGLWVDAFETARARIGVGHPNLVDVVAVGYVPGTGSVLVQRHPPRSTSLARLLDRVGRLKLSEAVRVGREIARGLGALHEAGLCHRQLQATNVMLRPDGGVLLKNAGVCFRPPGADEFGPPGLVFGDAHFVAPECLNGALPHPKSDIYALGALFYEMATGARPFEGEGLADLAQQHLELAPPNPTEVLEDLLPEAYLLAGRALAKDPAQRPGIATLLTQFDTLEASHARSGLTMKFQPHRKD